MSYHILPQVRYRLKIIVSEIPCLWGIVCKKSFVHFPFHLRMLQVHRAVHIQLPVNQQWCPWNSSNCMHQFRLLLPSRDLASVHSHLCSIFGFQNGKSKSCCEFFKIGISNLETNLGQAVFVHGKLSMSFKTFQCILVVNQLCFCCIEICEVLNHFFGNKTNDIEKFSTRRLQVLGVLYTYFLPHLYLQ